MPPVPSIRNHILTTATERASATTMEDNVLRAAALGGSVGLRSWRRTAAALAAGLLLVGLIGLHNISAWRPYNISLRQPSEMRDTGTTKSQAEADAKRAAVRSLSSAGKIRFRAARQVRNNGLAAGSSPSSPTTQSDPNRRFPVSDKEPAIGGPFCGLNAGRAVSAGCRGRGEGDFAARSLGSENPFLAPSPIALKIASIKSTSRASRIGATTRQERRADG